MNFLNGLGDFFNHPFFSILGGISTIFLIVSSLIALISAIKGVIPVWYRLGRGLAQRKIAIFAENDYSSLKKMLVDSNLFQEKNIVQINKGDIKKAKNFSVFLVHWETFKYQIPVILSLKNDNTTLVIYAPVDEGSIDKDVLKEINLERNSIIVNFRGRLLNDIFVSMMTTGYAKK